MLENNKRNANEEITEKVKKIIGMSNDKNEQEKLLIDFKNDFLSYLNTKEVSYRNLEIELKCLSKIADKYYMRLANKDFKEIYELLPDFKIELSVIGEYTINYYKNNYKELADFYKTYTGFFLDNIDNIEEVINRYLSIDSNANIVVFKNKIPINIKKSTEQILGSIDKTTYADYDIQYINRYDFKNTIGFIINDNSMFPKYEIDNIAFVSISDEIVDNKDYLIRIGKEYLVRKLKLKDNLILMVPLNPKYDIQILKKDEIEKQDIEFIGFITEIKINSI